MKRLQPQRPSTAPNQSRSHPTKPALHPQSVNRRSANASNSNNNSPHHYHHNPSNAGQQVSAPQGRDNADASAVSRVMVVPLTSAERANLYHVWTELVAKAYQVEITTVATLQAVLQASHIQLMPEVEAYSIKLFEEFDKRLDFPKLEEFITLCRAKHEEVLKKNPLLCDELLDAFVALGGEWDTKGNLDNNKMRHTIKTYDLKIDFDRFLHEVDTDGNAEVDFDEFRKLVEEREPDRSFNELGSRRSSELRLVDGSPTTISSQSSGAFMAAAAGQQPPLTAAPPPRVTAHERGSSDAAVKIVGVATAPPASTRVVKLLSISETEVSQAAAITFVSPSKSEAGHSRLDRQGSFKPLTLQNLAASSTTKSQVHRSPTDPSTKILEKVSVVNTRSNADVITKKMQELAKRETAVPAFYRELTKAVTNVWDMKSFRNRCGGVMQSADRCGETNGGSNQSQGAQQQHPGADADEAQPSALLEQKQQEFLARMCATLDSKKEIVEEKKASIQRMKQADRKRKNRKRKEGSPASPSRYYSNSDPESPSPGSTGRRSFLGAPINLRDLARNSSGSGLTRRRSQGVAVNVIPTFDEAMKEADDDDGMNSVYSTSSSQRSDDIKRQPQLVISQFMRSGKNSPNNPSLAPANDNSNGPQGLGSSPTAKGPAAKSYCGSNAARSAAKIKLRDRILMSSIPALRLSGNTNQLRAERVRPNTEEDETAKAKAKVPQVPAAKLTPRMRAKVAAVTKGEKKEACRLDEYGQERNEMDSKLFECYFGRV